MRNLLLLIILGAGGYFGWRAWQEQPAWLVRVLPKALSPATAATSAAPPEGADETPSDIPPTPNPAPAIPSASATPRAVATPSAPKFTSRIRPVTAPGDSSKVAPGTFLIINRASVETKDGVIAVVPGDQVRLVRRHKNGTLTVTNGQTEFIVKESQVTQDIATAQAAELQEFQKRIGRLR